MIKSPITGKPVAKLTESFDSDKIVALYAKEIGVDVSRYFAGIQQVGLCQCPDTGYRFFHPEMHCRRPAFYEALQQKLTYYHPFRWEHKQALRAISREDKVLEIGCGSGNFLLKLKDTGVDAAGIEFNEMAISEAVKKGLNVARQTLGELAAARPENFDAVCFFQVLEHITGVQEFITGALKTLKKGGKLIIGVPNNNPFLYRWDKWHTLNLPPPPFRIVGQKEPEGIGRGL
ncbi:MAG: class I SAM-dependent methyltransferase [Bacteroidales bacterium]|nr:class I SAM-dependent methyltransferase [Bacteroidales bacterium]